MKSLCFFLGFLLLFFSEIFSVFADDESLHIDIGSDRTVIAGDSLTLTAEISGTCQNMMYATLFWQIFNEKGDWKTLQSGGSENTVFTFTPTKTEQIRAQIRCPQGESPLFTSEILRDDAITVSLEETEESKPSVFAGEDTVLSSGNETVLHGKVTSSDCSVFDYQWIQVSGTPVEILQAGQNGVIGLEYNSAHFIFPQTQEPLVFRLEVRPVSCKFSGNVYFDTVEFSQKNEKSSGSSQNGKYKSQAEKIFQNEESIAEVFLEIQPIYKDKKNIDIAWNNIGGKGYVRYILEYSSDPEFLDSQIFFLRDSHFQMYISQLESQSLFHYFRVRAQYKEKYTNYSPVVFYVSQDFYTPTCHTGSISDFSDIIFSPETLLDTFFSIKCSSCEKNKYKEY